MKKNIAILAGGNSSEAVISIKSAETIQDEIDKGLYNAYTVVVKGTDWFIDDNGTRLAIDKNDFSFTKNGVKTRFDCAYMIIHGTPGEDGKLQGYLDALGVPYTTCNVLSASITFNKFFCKTYLKGFGVLMPKGVLVKKGGNHIPGEIIKITGLPCFVKPNAGGSSFGVSKVKTMEDLGPALEKAFEEDTHALVEEALTGTEITCGIANLKNKRFIFPLTEVVSKNEFFDYEAKYTTGMAEEITPARVSKEIGESCREISTIIYDALECTGIVRIDYMLSNNQLYFFEVNTVPGMSKNSIIPQQIRAASYTVREILTLVIEDAITRSR